MKENVLIERKDTGKDKKEFKEVTDIYKKSNRFTEIKDAQDSDSQRYRVTETNRDKNLSKKRYREKGTETERNIETDQKNREREREY